MAIRACIWQLAFAAARLIHRSSQYEHVTPMLRNLHWLQSLETHRFQAGCAHLPMPAWSGATVSFRLHPARRRFQPPPSSVVVILAAGDPTHTAVLCWRSCVSGSWKPPLKQFFAARRHHSSNADSFPEPPQNLSLSHVHCLPDCFRFLYTVYSNGLSCT